MTDTPELIAMARAIDPGVWALHDLFLGDMTRLTDWHRADHAKSLRQARAALEALRVLSPTTVSAMAKLAIGESVYGDNGGWPGLVLRRHTAIINHITGEL